MSHVQRKFVFIARSSAGKEHLVLRDRLGLDEQLVEGRVLAIPIVRRHG